MLLRPFLPAAAYATALLFVALAAVALPMSFEFRQLVSIAGVTVVELLLLMIITPLLLRYPRALLPARYQGILLLLYAFLLWAFIRALIGVMEGNELSSTLRSLRHYLPLLTLPLILYLLHKWHPDPERITARLAVCLSIGYFIYMAFLVAVVVSPTISTALMMRPFIYRISSSTIAISMTLLLLVSLLWLEGRVRARTMILTVMSVGVTLLLAQSRFSSAMLMLLIAFAVGLYTVRTLRTRFVGIGVTMLLSILAALGAAFWWLDATVDDFEKFSRLFLDRIERHQEGMGIWESMTKYSFGTEAFRARVIEGASDRPMIGFGEGKGVGSTMSQEDGAHIDSTVLTMWYKNGFVGLGLYYSFWLAILARLLRGYLYYRSRFKAGVASIACASVLAWLLWSTANVFLMYGWVLYPIMAFVSVSLFVLENKEFTSPAEKGRDKLSFGQ